MVPEGTWPSDIVKPSVKQLIEIFGPKTTWYEYYRPAFSTITQFPIMHHWLEGGNDRPTEEDAWGSMGRTDGHTLGDLKEWVMANKDKGKKKGKERSDGGEGKNPRRRRRGMGMMTEGRDPTPRSRSKYTVDTFFLFFFPPFFFVVSII